MTAPSESDNPIIEFIHDHPAHDNLGTYAAFANSAHVSVTVINNIRKGLYNSLPPSVGRLLEANSEFSKREWEQKYDEWRLDELYRLKRKIQLGQVEAVPLFVQADMLKEYYDTFADWRKEINASMLGFCTDFLVPHATITRYERGEGVKLPAVLKERLEFLDCSDAYIRELSKLPRRKEEVSYA